MGTEGVFAIGVSGMGPALSPTGERIVRSKMKARDRMLEDLAQALVLRQKGEIAHLKHQAAVQENKILLLRKALEAMRGGQ